MVSVEQDPNAWCFSFEVTQFGLPTLQVGYSSQKLVGKLLNTFVGKFTPCCQGPQRVCLLITFVLDQ